MTTPNAVGQIVRQTEGRVCGVASSAGSGDVRCPPGWTSVVTSRLLWIRSSAKFRPGSGGNPRRVHGRLRFPACYLLTRHVASVAPGVAWARWPSRSSKPVRSCNPRLGRFDSYAAPLLVFRLTMRIGEAVALAASRPCSSALVRCFRAGPAGGPAGGSIKGAVAYRDPRARRAALQISSFAASASWLGALAATASDASMSVKSRSAVRVRVAGRGCGRGSA